MILKLVASSQHYVVIKVERNTMFHKLLTLAILLVYPAQGASYNAYQDQSPFGIEIPDDEPTFNKVNSSFIFKTIGVLYPTISYVHIRGTLDTNLMEEMVNEVCARTRKIEQFFEQYINGKFQHMHEEIIKRYSKVSHGQEIGRKYFKTHMRSSLLLLEQSCVHAQGISRLALELLRKDTGDIDKRQIMGAAALLFSLYNREELNELSSKVSTTIQNQRHIVHGMNLVINETDKIRGNVVNLKHEFTQLERNLSMLEFEHSLTELT